MSAARRRSGQLLRSALLLLPLLAQGSSLPYSPEHASQCLDLAHEYFELAINRCCRLCPPGFHVRHHCSESIDTQCEACRENSFMKNWNSAANCFGCTPQCKKGLVEIEKCTSTQDRHCWCPSHAFCSTKVDNTCVRCRPYQLCKKGYGVITPGTNSSDVKCAPCKPGTFSDVESDSATCRPHRVCRVELIPGNSTNDAVCTDSSALGGVPVSSPYTTVKSQDPSTLDHSVTSRPNLSVDAVQRKPSADIGYIIGGVAASLFLVVALVGVLICIISRRKAAQLCKQAFGGEKQLSPSTGKGSDKWSRISSTVRQEEENLLQISPSSSGSLDPPPASDRTSETSGVDDSKTEEEGSQRSTPLNTCVHHDEANSKQTANGGTYVNISCVVNVCSSDHGSQRLSANSSTDTDTSPREDVPLSKEESPIQREAEGQTAVEVEEDHTFSFKDGKPLPLSVQDVGMSPR